MSATIDQLGLSGGSFRQRLVFHSQLENLVQMSGERSPGELRRDSGAAPAPGQGDARCGTMPACPVCGGRLIEIRAKLQCQRCHTICETCCEGGPG